MEVMIKDEIVKLGVSLNCRMINKDKCLKNKMISESCQTQLRNSYQVIQKCQDDIIAKLHETEDSFSKLNDTRSQVCCLIEKMKGCVDSIKV